MDIIPKRSIVTTGRPGLKFLARAGRGRENISNLTTGPGLGFSRFQPRLPGRGFSECVPRQPAPGWGSKNGRAHDKPGLWSGIRSIPTSKTRFDPFLDDSEKLSGVVLSENPAYRKSTHSYHLPGLKTLAWAGPGK